MTREADEAYELYASIIRKMSEHGIGSGDLSDVNQLYCLIKDERERSAKLVEALTEIASKGCLCLEGCEQYHGCVTCVAKQAIKEYESQK
jgi:hypothetical protein